MLMPHKCEGQSLEGFSHLPLEGRAQRPAGGTADGESTDAAHAGQLASLAMGPREVTYPHPSASVSSSVKGVLHEAGVGEE